MGGGVMDTPRRNWHQGHPVSSDPVQLWPPGSGTELQGKAWHATGSIYSLEQSATTNRRSTPYRPPHNLRPLTVGRTGCGGVEARLSGGPFWVQEPMDKIKPSSATLLRVPLRGIDVALLQRAHKLTRILCRGGGGAVFGGHTCKRTSRLAGKCADCSQKHTPPAPSCVAPPQRTSRRQDPVLVLLVREGGEGVHKVHPPIPDAI